MARRAKTRIRQEEREHKAKRQWLIRTVGAIVGVLAIAGFIVWAFQQGQAQKNIGEHVAYQGQEHIDDGSSHPPYNSDPPTSGSHSNTPARAGFYDTPIPDENIVHNLEHGYVVVSYDCNQLDDCETVQNNLKKLVQRYNTWKVVAVPRTNRDAAIAVTAWQRIELLDNYDEARISAFINAWRDKGPEKTPN